MNRYMELNEKFPLRPIRSEEQLDRAIFVLNSLIDQAELSDDEQDYLDVLGDLIRKYETTNFPMTNLSDSDLLKHLMESQKLNQAVLSQKTGIAASTLSMVLCGRRKLNRRHIQALSKFFRVSSEVFLTRTS